MKKLLLALTRWTHFRAAVLVYLVLNAIGVFCRFLKSEKWIYWKQPKNDLDSNFNAFIFFLLSFEDYKIFLKSHKIQSFCKAFTNKTNLHAHFLLQKCTSVVFLHLRRLTTFLTFQRYLGSKDQFTKNEAQNFANIKNNEDQT